MNTLKEKTPTVYAGLDIAKATLQLHFQNTHHVLANNPQGHATLLRKLRAVPGVQVICEATGGYEKGIVTALQAAAQPVSVLNPALVRHFARAQGQRAKNDPIDAEILTAYGRAMHPAPTPPSDPARDQLRALVQWREHLKEQLTRARQTVEHGLPAWIARQQKKLVAHLEKQMEAVARQCQEALAQADFLQAQVRRLEELEAVGTITALSVLSHLPELGTLNRQEAAALAGLAPWVRQSGPWEGQRHIGGGRAAVRRALYMSAVALGRMPQTTLGKFYARLRAAGKPAKVALTAVMRKLLLQMNRVLKEQALQTQAKTPTATRLTFPCP
jgi:transposase